MSQSHHVKLDKKDFKKGKVVIHHGLRTKTPNVKILMDNVKLAPKGEDIPKVEFPDGTSCVITIKDPELVQGVWCVYLSKGDKD